MLPFLSEDFGNANSIHGFGRKAMAAVDLARERIADLIGAEDPSQVVFTSGASESNNWILRAYDRAAVSPFEHSSVVEAAEELGLEVLESQALDIAPPKEQIALISVMAVNNEIGTTWDVRKLKGKAVRTHADATQA